MYNQIDYLNRGPPVLFLALKSNAPHVYAVEQLSDILQKLNSKTIIKLELNEQDIIEALKSTSLKERVSVKI
jgi:hypothetical protein